MAWPLIGWPCRARSAAACRIARSTNAVSLLSEHSHPAISPANASTLQLLWQPTMLGPQLGHAPTPTDPGSPRTRRSEAWMLVAVIVWVMPIIPFR